VRRLALMFLMCLMLGGLGGLLAATVHSPETARARFTPPREQAFDFRLRDQNGRRTSLADARGKVVAMTFIYTSCRDLCPAEGNEIAAALKRFDSSGVEVYVVSVDPIGDTPARVKQWLERRNLPADRSRYLIGSRAQLQPVWRAYGIVPLVASRAETEAALQGSEKYWKENPYRPGSSAYPYAYPSPRPASSQSQEAFPNHEDMQYRGRARHVAGWDFEHSAYVLLLDKHGVQRVGIPFEQLDPGSLARDLRALLAER
jgi:cytochrome oxidase Cu insertion factor (SCO1/SenC/PrrC family)